MKMLVTGGAGFIGSHMSRMLQAQGIDVVVLDTLEFGHKEALPSNIELVRGDVGDASILESLFQKHTFSGVMHFAGYIQVEESVKFPVKYMKNNLIGPIALLEAMKAAGVLHLIFSSTAAVYGNPISNLIDEDHPKNPVSPYGLSKWSFEEILRVYDRSSGIKSITLRYFNAAGASLDGAYGEGHFPETHLIPLAIAAGLGRRPEFTLYGTDYETPDGTAMRDFIHVEDLCQAHILALNALKNGHKTDVFNVGTGQGITVKTVTDITQKETGVDFLVKTAQRRPGDPAVLVSNPAKIQKELGWKPQYSDIGHIVKSAFSWHKAHPDGYTHEHRN